MAGIQRARRHKRSDIPTEVVLAMVSTYGPRAYEALCETFHHKVVQAAIRRDGDRGYLDFGCSEIRGWLTPAGEKFIRTERYKVIC